MALTKVPHPLLKKSATPADVSALKNGLYDPLLDEMRTLMKSLNGIGLAANQDGTDLALFVIDKALADEHGVPDAFANPEITDYGKETDALEEGCLSIPGFWAPIRRSKKIMFKALDARGKRVKFRARGMLARVLQHETDHLIGTTIAERVSDKKNGLRA
jgi:peptide deformylase